MTAYLLVIMLYAPVVAGSIYLFHQARKVRCSMSRWFMTASVAAFMLGVNMVVLRVNHIIESRIMTHEQLAWVMHDSTQAGYIILTMLAAIIYLRRIKIGGNKRHDDRLG